MVIIITNEANEIIWQISARVLCSLSCAEHVSQVKAVGISLPVDINTPYVSYLRRLVSGSQFVEEIHFYGFRAVLADFRTWANMCSLRTLEAGKLPR